MVATTGKETNCKNVSEKKHKHKLQSDLLKISKIIRFGFIKKKDNLLPDKR